MLLLWWDFGERTSNLASLLGSIAAERVHTLRRQPAGRCHLRVPQGFISKVSSTGCPLRTSPRAAAAALAGRPSAGARARVSSRVRGPSAARAGRLAQAPAERLHLALAGQEDQHAARRQRAVQLADLGFGRGLKPYQNAGQEDQHAAGRQCAVQLADLGFGRCLKP